MWHDALNLAGTLPLVVVMVHQLPLWSRTISVFAFVLVASCVCKGMCIHISHIIIIKLPLNFFREHILCTFYC